MYCLRCGREIPDGELFCGTCGKQPIERQQPPENRPPERVQEARQTTAKRQEAAGTAPKKRMNRLLIPFLLVCLLLVLACAFCFAAHIQIIDHFSPMVDGVRMSCIQFFVCGVLALIPMFLTETPRWGDILAAANPILYAGVMSSGVAYTLQIIGQKHTNPTVASMIMSLESVFAVITGILVLHQTPTVREVTGCVIMFAAIILAQLPEKKRI